MELICPCDNGRKFDESLDKKLRVMKMIKENK